MAIVFDGDDTLWETQVFYSRAKEYFYALMLEQGFDREAARHKLAEIDVANVSRLGFSKHRFPLSMREVYEYFCRTTGEFVDPAVLEKASDIGYSVLDNKPPLVKGARELLSCLEQHSYNCYLYTAGDLDIQCEKIEALNIAGYFKAIYIRESKNEEGLRNIIAEQGLESGETWVVGNSLRSDVKPALELGLRCIWLANGGWEYDETELDVSDWVWRVTDLTEALPLLLDGQC